MAELSSTPNLFQDSIATMTAAQLPMASVYSTAGASSVSTGQRRPITKSQFATNVLAPQLALTNYATATPPPPQLDELPFQTYFSTNVFQDNRYPSLPPATNHRQPLTVDGNIWRQVTTSLAHQQQKHDTQSRNGSAPTGAQVSPVSSLSGEENTESDDEEYLSHPNKFPVEIEHHSSKQCCYRRQPTRSGPKLKHRHEWVYNPNNAMGEPEVQVIKYYQKDLVRICRCGTYSQMDGALVHGRANDCDGYEIHYSQKCKWKAYDDYKTGKRVLIRLCKCYKPMA